MARVDPNDAPLLLALYCINADELVCISNPKYSAMNREDEIMSYSHSLIDNEKYAAMTLANKANVNIC